MSGSSFLPTFLYIKQHTKTGKLYFGKTVLKDPVKYKGSGTYWQNHINHHGVSDVDTLWYCLFTEEETIKDFALMCSSMWNIVGDDSWANLITESGSGDYRKSESTLEKIGRSKIGNTYRRGSKHTEEAKLRNREAHLGKKHSDESKAKIKLHSGVRGRSRTKDEIERISAALTGVSHDTARVAKMIETKLNSRKKWYSNEMETKLFDANSVPDGWVPGRKNTKEINNVKFNQNRPPF